MWITTLTYASTLNHNAYISNKGTNDEQAQPDKSIYIPDSPEYREAKRDLIFIYIVAGVMVVVGLVALWVY